MSMNSRPDLDGGQEQGVLAGQRAQRIRLHGCDGWQLCARVRQARIAAQHKLIRNRAQNSMDAGGTGAQCRASILRPHQTAAPLTSLPPVRHILTCNPRAAAAVHASGQQAMQTLKLCIPHPEALNERTIRVHGAHHSFRTTALAALLPATIRLQPGTCSNRWGWGHP